ncbi:hypothetical protein GCM10010193_55260 [Kitasatospora atroaurantiaca]|uniref:Uncharacterized protein YkwD n=1 Tax=Kitasatospora atroaurantiaca TaxID=285545 RepID=A0A561EVT3_9ACTN|nr:CAP domain-containing protein [Kitasatospora atroaurantiaca]TWE19716.1 uncharacterized protein YkwD [Kitasatospora atroaurantiaca]
MGRHAARQRAGSVRRRTGGALALCCTALAAGAGGVVLKALPLSPTSSQPTVIADGPLPQLSPATAADTTSAPQPVRRETSSPAASPTPVRTAPSPVAADRGETRSPLATATPSAVASTVATVRPAVRKATQAAAVLALVNQERAKAGCAPLAADPRLDTLATAFSDDMAARDFFSHTDPDGRTPWDRAKTASIGYLGGENIARGQRTPEEVMAAWMNSPGHRANILNCHYTKLGVGVHEGTGGPWWTQDFGF